MGADLGLSPGRRRAVHVQSRHVVTLRLIQTTWEKKKKNYSLSPNKGTANERR